MDYKKILEGVVNIINTTEKSDIGFANICTYIGESCPELAESEDEKIRKVLVELVKCNEKSGYFMFNNITTSSMLAWLEKQGEQKPTWSEEDENRINRLIAYFEDKESFTAEDDIEYANWLKSLKDRYVWKPSDEQMKAFDAFIEKACEWIKMMWSETDDRFKEDYTEMLVENFKNYMKGE